ncbi:TPA: hypothetical protein I8Y21_006357 [Klebsiella oxytoca]|uniref:Uncharacterized protein n=1 Tax=Klebsiella oxytoca TaxID=571 RepID=A0AAN5RH28_KLEOX|nr:hypothetical protein [Klebsiella oxytoca]
MNILNEIGFISVGDQADFDFYHIQKNYNNCMDITSSLMETIGSRAPALIMINGCLYKENKKYAPFEGVLSYIPNYVLYKQWMSHYDNASVSS